MARNRLGAKKVARLQVQYPDLDIVAALTRGGTDHRIDLCLRDGTVVHLYRDGTRMKSSIRHVYKSPDAERNGT